MLNKKFIIPENLLELEDDQFFEFVDQFVGNKVTNILKFQDITNANCFLTCDDPLEVLNYDSDDLLDMKKKTCVKLNDNSFVILPGVKSKMNILKNLLNKKSNEFKKALKTLSFIPETNGSFTITSETNNNSTDLIHTRAEPSMSSSSSSNINSKGEEEVKKYLIESINDWCKNMDQSKSEHQQQLELKENIDYEIIIDINGNKAFIKCNCGTTSTLGKKYNTYMVSHLLSKIVDYFTEEYRKPRFSKYISIEFYETVKI